ncbi:MAG: hypothetical protein RLZZ58_1535 [Pseudomonadota bacterium]|jgi:signal transduction histidine kinase/ActR/RegA family two-component response regulator
MTDDDRIDREPTANLWAPGLAALLLAGLVVALIFQLGQASRARDAALVAQGRSYEIIYLAKSLDASINRAEAALGRFAVGIENKDDGRVFQSEWRRAGATITALERRVRRDPAQMARLTKLKLNFLERGTSLSGVALSANYRQNMAAISKFYAASKSITVNVADRELDAIVTAERARLLERVTEVTATTNSLEQSIFLLGLLGVTATFGVVGFGYLALQIAAQRRVARQEAVIESQRTAGLELAVAERTAELETANERLRMEAIELAEAEARLRQAQKLEAVGQLTGGIAHDFNNMLAVVVGGIELGMRMIKRAPDKAQRHFENAMDGANRASALTKRLLAFARAEPAMPEHLVPGDAIRQFFDLLDRTIGDRIELSIDDQAGVWQCWVDRSQLENALLNLAVNARDAMAGHGTLTIATRPVHERVGASAILTDFVAISVSDTGCGMAPEVAERVFDPFYTTKPVGQGTGLGMSQVFAFARQSQGDVRLDSVEGEGTTVTMLLPRVAAPAPRGAEAVRQAVAISESAGTGMKILLVEDDPRVLAATRDALVELGHAVITCENPRNAAGLLGTHGDIGFILSDVLMPEMTGPEMVAQILPDWPAMPVLFATGFAGEAGDGDAFGGHEVIRKPYTLASLELAMEAAKSRSLCRHPYVAAVAAAI